MLPQSLAPLSPGVERRFVSGRIARGSNAYRCSGLWEHYAFTDDREFLKTWYPVMKGSAEFLVSLLVEERPVKLDQWIACSDVSMTPFLQT